MRKAYGYTLIEVVIAVASLASLGVSIWLVTLIVRALLKYLGS